MPIVIHFEALSYMPSGVHKPILLMRKLRLEELFNLPKGRVGLKLIAIYSRAFILFSMSCCFPCLKINHWKMN